MHFYLSGK